MVKIQINNKDLQPETRDHKKTFSHVDSILVIHLTMLFIESVHEVLKYHSNESFEK